jgi:predicted amidophosphoribosyltransferase
MNKLARLLNVDEVFVLNESEKEQLTGKNIWLADDVLTTGSTILSSAGVLCKEPIAAISIATIAMA